MHDIVNLEGRGIPAVAVITEEFQTAALSQGSALGFDPAFVTVTHPIQDRSHLELKEIARGVFAEILDSLTA